MKWCFCPSSLEFKSQPSQILYLLKIIVLILRFSQLQLDTEICIALTQFWDFHSFKLKWLRDCNSATGNYKIIDPKGKSKIVIRKFFYHTRNLNYPPLKLLSWTITLHSSIVRTHSKSRHYGITKVSFYEGKLDFFRDDLGLAKVNKKFF